MFFSVCWVIRVRIICGIWIVLVMIENSLEISCLLISNFSLNRCGKIFYRKKKQKNLISSKFFSIQRSSKFWDPSAIKISTASKLNSMNFSNSTHFFFLIYKLLVLEILTNADKQRIHLIQMGKKLKIIE